MTPEKKTFIVDEGHSGWRIDRFLPDVHAELSRASFQRLIKDGHVSVNGTSAAHPKQMVSLGSRVDVEFPVEEPLRLSGELLDLKVLYEDDDLLVLDKPPDMVVHPAAGNWSGTVVNALLGRDTEFAERFEAGGEEGGEASHDPLRPGIVHRLDKDTSGCLVVAKNAASKRRLSADFEERNVTKIYYAISLGHPQTDSFEARTLIGRHHIERKKMAVVEIGGRDAVTLVETERKGWIDNEPVCLLKVRILTGRTHQIRVHLAHMRLPVIGDSVYGPKKPRVVAPRQMLHARLIEFPHPATRRLVSLESPFSRRFRGAALQDTAGESARLISIPLAPRSPGRRRRPCFGTAEFISSFPDALRDLDAIGGRRTHLRRGGDGSGCPRKTTHSRRRSR